ncbi:PAM68 family protein [Synechocystis sp. PCC 7509]|uniref:PAM68 family protein n=1 Tax=Synechocystis sp. PCC 7509 TaxID=927677 RepID=UPI0002ACAB06|nr:PAM68 family protein [Synechocystis sp. PCC 7509]
MATEPERQSLPFEPSKKAPKAAKSTEQPAAKPKSVKSNYKPQKAPVSTKNQANKPPFTKEEMALPKVVSDRMARRMVVFCGVPTVLGMATLIGGYVAISHGIKPPGVLVLLSSMGFLGLSVLGLTYGILSASWEEEVAGSKLGVQEFVINWGRMLTAWKSTRQKNP